MSVTELPAVKDGSDPERVLIDLRGIIDRTMSRSLSRLSSSQKVGEIARTMITNAVQCLRRAASTILFAQEPIDAINDLANGNIHTEVLCDRSVALSEIRLPVPSSRIATDRVAPWAISNLLIVDSYQAFSLLPAAGREALCVRGNELIALLNPFYTQGWSSYRRHVADLLRELDVQSRFQAGRRAAYLGLTDAHDHG